MLSCRGTGDLVSQEACVYYKYSLHSCNNSRNKSLEANKSTYAGRVSEVILHTASPAEATPTAVCLPFTSAIKGPPESPVVESNESGKLQVGAIILDAQRKDKRRD